MRAGRVELGDHELARVINVHHRAIRARKAYEEITQVLGRDLDLSLAREAKEAVAWAQAFEAAALRLRRNHERRHAPQQPDTLV